MRRQRGQHAVGPAVLEQVGGRDVDRHREVRSPRARQSGGLAQGLADHQLGQRADHAGLLGERDELVGRDHAADGVRPAHERLDAGDPVAAEVELGLEVQRQVVARRPRRAARRSAAGARGCAGRARARRTRCPSGGAWPGTSRRRRAGAASRRRGRARGSSATPMLAAICSSMPSTVKRSDERRGDPLAGALGGAARRAAATANSSPPSRATWSPARSAVRIRGPSWASTRSPAWWPSVSLSSLKWSRSITSSASEPSVGARAVDRAAQLAVEPAAVREPGQLVRARLAAGLGEPAQLVDAQRVRTIATTSAAAAKQTATGVTCRRPATQQQADRGACRRRTGARACASRPSGAAPGDRAAARRASAIVGDRRPARPTSSAGPDSATPVASW